MARPKRTIREDTCEVIKGRRIPFKLSVRGNTIEERKTRDPDGNLLYMLPGGVTATKNDVLRYFIGKQ